MQSSKEVSYKVTFFRSEEKISSVNGSVLDSGVPVVKSPVLICQNLDILRSEVSHSHISFKMAVDMVVVSCILPRIV